VLAIRKLDGKGAVKACVDIQLGGVTLKGSKIVQQDGQTAWLAMPAVKSNRGWNNVVELSKLLRERATEVALKAWETHQQRDLISGGAKGWSKRQRDEHVEELAARFDARPPDEVPF
jgi:DNA-binding cell septation regulator SpoVG